MVVTAPSPRREMKFGDKSREISVVSATNHLGPVIIEVSLLSKLVKKK